MSDCAQSGASACGKLFIVKIADENFFVILHLHSDGGPDVHCIWHQKFSKFAFHGINVVADVLFYTVPWK